MKNHLWVGEWDAQQGEWQAGFPAIPSWEWHIPASSRKGWLTEEGCSGTTHACRARAHLPHTLSSNLQAQWSQESSHEHPNFMHQAPYTTQWPHCAAVAAMAAFRDRRRASAWPPSIPIVSAHVKVVSHSFCQGVHHIPVCSPGIIIQNKSPKGKK